MISTIEHPGSSLKVQLIIIVGLSLLVLSLIPALFFMHSLKNQLRAEVIADINKELQLVSHILKHSREQGDLLCLVQNLKYLSGDRITCIADDGTVLADSDLPKRQIKEMENHASRPEIRMARAHGLGYSIRYSGTLGKKMIYAARKIKGLPHTSSGFLRIARPYSRLDQGLKATQNKLLRTTLLTLLATGLLIYVFLSLFSKKIRQLVQVAQAIGQGDFEQRITKVPSKEFLPLGQAINDLAQEIAGKLNLIARQRSELIAIFSAIETGLAVLDNKGRLVRVNRAFVKIYPGAYNSLGKQLIELTLDPRLQKKCQEFLSPIPGSRGRKQNPLNNQDKQDFILEKDGHYYEVRFTRGQKRQLALLIALHEITELKKTEQLRRDFVANVSHELRTPLTAIKGYTETLLQVADLPEKQRRAFLEIILKNSDHMAGLLKDILFLAKTEAGKLGLSKQRINLETAVYKAWKNLHHVTQIKAIGLQVKVSPGCRQVMSDPLALQTILQNILENSLKVVPLQDPKIIVQVKPQGEKALIGIEDNGPGVPKNEQDRIFERFYQIGKNERDTNSCLAPGKGTGLGLSICKNILNNLGERIWVQSPIRNGQGTIFWFTLPQASDKD